MLNFSKIKSDFPIFKRHINDRPIVYLDSTASSLKPQKVIDAINAYYTKYSVNIFRGVYTLSEEATSAYENARESVAKFIGANSNEVIFVRNATEAINLMASTWGESQIKKGTNVVTTVMEHHANIVPWQVLTKKSGAEFRILDIDETGILKLEDLDKLIDKKTILLAITYVSNVLGTVNPVKEIIKKAKSINPHIKVLVDAAAAVPHMKVDVKDLNCDFLAFSGHKMLGPTGVGILWGRPEILEEMPPYQYGGDMIKEVSLYSSTYKNPPHKFEAGTPHIAGGIGLGEAVEYLTNIGMENIRMHEIEITSYALSQLNKQKDLKIYGPKKAPDKGGVISFSIDGIHPHDLAQILNEDNICVRSGHHCAMPVHKKLGLIATTRASFYLYNDKKDVDALVTGIEKAKNIFKI